MTRNELLAAFVVAVIVLAGVTVFATSGKAVVGDHGTSTTTTATAAATDSSCQSLTCRYESVFPSNTANVGINATWVQAFVQDVNSHRTSDERHLVESLQLDQLAAQRFETMQARPGIVSYGLQSNASAVEDVLFPYNVATQYINVLQNVQPLHWQLLVSPVYGAVGVHLGRGPVFEIGSGCQAAEVPRTPGYNLTAFFVQQHGCHFRVMMDYWLVMELGP